ncbi:hypothetical protein [Nocardioides sp. CFH 31398]|uniref:hypothetical protein n=1 Tax=Nocardioides sp. CFH 31398 TaxID=2919579 RepID=UPI001F06832C|nr:hypothetical protein [Nocardioides sp. CFH 31398]MCH1868999.1 hypothetical protein [Nocardioides sp. CFH 31398]
MSPRTLTRASGAALVVQFLLCLAGGVLHPVVEGRAHSAEALTAAGGPVALTLLLSGTVLLVVAFPAAIAHLAPHVGRVGTVAAIGHLVALVVVVVPHLAVELMVAPVLARDAGAVHLIDPTDSIVDAPVFLASQALGGLVMMGCLAVLGVTVVRSALPSWIGWSMVAALVVLFVPLPALPVLMGLQIEVPRGLALAGVGVLVLRALGPAPDGRERTDVVAVR